MRFNLRLVLITVVLSVAFSLGAQTLSPGFDKDEFTELFKALSCQGDSIDINSPNYIGEPSRYERIYRSAVMGLENRWDLWKRESATEDTYVVALRGTTGTAASWMENFYCAMVPAKGKLQLNDSTVFEYHFADDPKAAVHVGWTLGMAYLAPDIMFRLKELTTAGKLKNLYVVGHSQGGALAFLLTSYLRHKIKAGELPADIVIKTYSSASPKVGNLYYAYDYDYINRGVGIEYCKFSRLGARDAFFNPDNK